jgi:endonuclease/exonuclease/phosphatase family metal-dependent hydrolase
MILVASYNMRKAIGTDRRRRPERTLEVLNEVGADVVALQEADRRFGARHSAIPLHLIEEHSPYKPVPFQARAGSLGWHGNAILVRKEAEVLGMELLHLPSLEPRGAVLADLSVNGAALRVVGMHLDLSGLWRRRQAAAILQHLERRPGDPPTGADGRSQRMERQRRLPARLRGRAPHRDVRTQLPCPPADGHAGPDHRQRQRGRGRERHPSQPDRAAGERPPADLGEGESS